MLKKLTSFVFVLFLFPLVINAQNIEVYVTNINLLVPANGYSAEDVVRGTVEIKNFDTQRGYDNLMYKLKLVGQYAEDGFPRMEYEEREVGEIQILPGETKKLDLSYTLPKQIPEGTIGISAELSISSGGTIAKKDTLIPLRGGIVRADYLQLKEASVHVNGEKFNVNEGPTVKMEDSAFVEMVVINGGEKDMNVYPSLKVWNKNEKGVIVFEKTYERELIRKQSIKDIQIDLPKLSKPAVYEGELSISNEIGIIAPKVPFRFIVQGDIISIHDLSSDKYSGGKGDVINVYMTYSGSPINIQTREDVAVDADVEIVLISDKGEEVGNYSEEMSLKGTHTLTLPIVLTKNVKNISSIQAKVIKDGNIISQLSSIPLLKKDSRDIFNDFILAAIVIIIAAIIGFFINKKKKAVIASIVLLICVASMGIFIDGNAFTLTIEDDPKSDWGDGASLLLYEPSLDQKYLVGESIRVRGRFSDRRCENYTGIETAITLWISNSPSGGVLVGKDRPTSVSSSVYDDGHEYGVNNDFTHNFLFTSAVALKEKIEEDVYAALGGTIGGTANCGSKAGVPSLTQPIGFGLCGNLDIASAVTCSTGYWRWTCTEGFSSVSCTAPYTGTGACAPAPVTYDGVCGTADGGAYENKPSSNLCTLGTSSSVGSSSDGTLWTWNCTGTTGVKDSCSAVKIKRYPAIPIGTYYLFADGYTKAGNESDEITHYRGYQRIHVVESRVQENGLCYPYLEALTVPPAENQLCSIGYPSTVTDSLSSYSWTCSGRNGGTNASCLVAKAVATSGVCGSSNGIETSAQPDSGLCSTGTSSSVIYNSGTRTWDWTCSGSYGGQTVSCSAPYPSGDCGPGQELCDGGCVTFGTCVDGCPSGKIRCGEDCVSPELCQSTTYGPMGMNAFMDPSVAQGGKCTIKIEFEDPTNVTCTINGESIGLGSHQVDVGEYSVVCTNSTYTESAELTCRENPIFKEF